MTDTYTPPAFPGTPQQMSQAFEWLRGQALQAEGPAALLLHALATGNAVGDVIFERCRQIHLEGWTHEHDDEHMPGDLAQAGACYASAAAAGLEHPGGDYASLPSPRRWPWRKKWWKPKDPRRDLVRAGALILAEIERIDREKARG